MFTNSILYYPKLKGKVLSSDKAINPFFRWIQILFSLASQPAANAVLSTLRFNLLANSGIEISPISFRAHQTMQGHYEMIDENGVPFSIDIPVFRLAVPTLIH